MLVGVELLRHLPVVFPVRIPRGKFDIPEQQISLEHIVAFGEHLLAHLYEHLFLTLPPEGLNQSHAGIKAVGLFGHHAAKFLDGLGEHMPFGIETSQTRSAQPQLRVLAAPGIYIES